MQAEAADFQAYFKSWAAYYGYTFQPNTLQVIIHESLMMISSSSLFVIHAD
jgi:hypothetical protein